MAEERNKVQNGGSGWLATIVGALLLIATGFGVGLVAGTAYEEPELVAEHLAGRTTEVLLGGDDEQEPGAAPPAPADDVAAAPPPLAAPAGPEAEEPLPTPLGAGALDAPREAVVARAAPATPAKATSAAKPKPATPVASTQGGGFAIQVGAFATEGTAAQLANELGKRGFPCYVAEEGAGARYKVRVGPLGSRSEAEQVSARLKSQHRLPTWILAGKS